MNTLALLVAAALAAQAQAATAPAAGTAAKAAAQAPAAAEAQKQLAQSMTHWALLCRPDSADPRMQRLAERLGELRARADQKPDPVGTERLKNDFEVWKNDLAALLYSQSRVPLAEATFRRDLEKSVAGLAAIAEDPHVTDQDLKKVHAQMRTLRRLVGPVAANYYFDRAKSQGGVGVLAAAREQGGGGTAQFFKGYTGKPRVLHPDQTAAVPAQFVDYKPESASGWSLKGVIETVSATAKRYAGKVADSIVNFAHKYGIDERLEAAFVWVESAFNPHAKSGAGAMGLGQLMPGTAAGLGVRNPYDIDQNVRGSASFVKTLLNQFSTPDEIRYTQGLYAWGRTRVQQGEAANTVWREVFAKTPLGVKNAVAAYNAGAGAITVYAHGDYRKLPRKHTAQAQRDGEGYWQTVNYVPAVLHRYFDIYLKTPADRGGPSIFAI